METLLVTGVETVTGANIAATLSDRFHVIGVTRRAGLEIEGCEIRQLTAFDSDSAVRLLRETRPAWIIECDAAAVSSWDPAPREMRDGSLVTDARLWARAAAECDCPLTFVSSDAVFSGPWMFHHEQSSSWCSSEEAEGRGSADFTGARPGLPRDRKSPPQGKVTARVGAARPLASLLPAAHLDAL